MICLLLGYECNNDCLNCPNIRNQELKSAPTSRILSSIDKFDKNTSQIILSGGEPTIRKDIFIILNHIKNKLPKAEITFFTNGRIFCYPSFVNKIVHYGISYFTVSLYAANPLVHDSITQVKGSFRQTTKGIKNLIESNQRVTILTIIHKLNYKELPKIADYIKNNFGSLNWSIGYLDIVGNAHHNRDKLIVPFSLIIPYLSEAIDKLKPRKNNLQLVNMFPLCLLPKRYHKFSDLDDREKAVFFKKGGTDIELSKKRLVFSDNCNECLYIKKCSGIWESYKDNIGLSEFKAIN